MTVKNRLRLNPLLQRLGAFQRAGLPGSSLPLALASLIATTTAVAAPPCNPLSSETCALPFPSDYWSVPSSQSPTGQVLKISDNVLPDDVLEQLSARDVKPSAILNGDSGFSPASPVLFEFASLPVSGTLPGDGGDAVKVINTRTGEALEIRAELREVSQG